MLKQYLRRSLGAIGLISALAIPKLFVNNVSKNESVRLDT